MIKSRTKKDLRKSGASRTVATVLSTPGESSVKSFASRCPAPSPLRFGSPPVWRRFGSTCQACGLAPPARLSGCRPDAPYSAYSPCCSACSSGEDQVCRRRGGRARAVHLFVVFVARLVEVIKRLSLPSPRAPAHAERRPAARAPCTMEPRSWVPPAVSVEPP